MFSIITLLPDFTLTQQQPIMRPLQLPPLPMGKASISGLKVLFDKHRWLLELDIHGAGQRLPSELRY
ncbi:hypothetical protein [Limnohabitans radicicola]|nr:hypothetical protein [Limnohabitans radicicola]